MSATVTTRVGGPLRQRATLSGSLGRLDGLLLDSAQPPPQHPAAKEGSAVAKLQVELVAVEHKVWAGEADMVVAKTTEGELGILPGHVPMLGQLAEPGQVRVKRGEGGESAWEVTGGFLSVNADVVTVLAEEATPATPTATR